VLRGSLSEFYIHLVTHFVDATVEMYLSYSVKTLPVNTQHSKETDVHDPGRIRTHNPSNRAAADPRLKTARPLGLALCTGIQQINFVLRLKTTTFLFIIILVLGPFMEFLIRAYTYIQQPRFWERGAANDVYSTNFMHMTHLDPMNNE